MASSIMAKPVCGEGGARRQGESARGTSDSLAVRLFGIDPRTLALFRVLLGLVLLYDIGQRCLDFTAMYTEAGVMPQAVVRRMLGASSWAWSLYFITPAWWFQGFLLGLTLLAAAALLIGYRTRTATLLAWLLVTSLHIRAPATVIGGDALLAMLLLWSIFLPLGATWSFDALHRPRPQPMVRHVAGAAAMGIMAAMYFMTGISKSNDIWISGRALQHVFGYGLIARPLAHLLQRAPLLLTLGSWWTLAIELAAPFLFFSPWRTRLCRRIALLNFVFLHLAVEATMCVIIFSYVSLAGLSLFVDRPFWETGWGQRPAAWLDAILHDGRVEPVPGGGATRWSNAVAGLLVGAVVFVNAPFFWWRGDFVYHLSPPARRTAELLGCCCRFDMFGTPTWPDYRFVAAAETLDGRVIDLLRDGRRVDLAHVAQLEPSTPSHRWVGFYVDLMRPEKAIFRESFAKYLWRQWQARHPQTPLKNVRLLVVLDSTSTGPSESAGGAEFSAGGEADRDEAEGTEFPGLLLAVYDPLVTGRYVHGKREGPFVMYHAPGVKAAEGTYRADRPVGRWRYYDRNGRLEGEGRYVDGRMQGRWTFYYEDGRQSEAWFESGRRVPPPAK